MYPGRPVRAAMTAIRPGWTRILQAAGHSLWTRTAADPPRRRCVAASLTLRHRPGVSAPGAVSQSQRPAIDVSAVSQRSDTGAVSQRPALSGLSARTSVSQRCFSETETALGAETPRQ